MQLTFLGTSAAWPSAHRGNVCFVAHSREPVLFECGPGILQQLAIARIEPRSIRTAIVSHIHGDHSLGLPMLFLAAQIGRRDTPLTVCLPQSAIAPIKNMCLTVYPNLGKVIDELVEWVALPEDAATTLRIPGDAVVRTARAEHPVPVVSTHVDFTGERRTVAFSGDTAYCERVALNAEGADLLVHESNWSVTLKTSTGRGHSTAADAGSIGALAKANRLALVHATRELATHDRELVTEAAAHFKGEVLVPADQTTIEL